MLRALILLLLCAAPAIAQQVVTFDVSVFDDKHEPAAGLSARDFRLFEDGVEQRVTFSESERKPLTIGIVFDGSGSMGGMPWLGSPRALMKAVESFLAECTPLDSYFLVEVSQQARLSVRITRDRDDILEGLRVPGKGKTALVDGILMAVEQLTARNDGILVAITDGGDNVSKRGWTDIEARLKNSPTTFVALNPERRPMPPEEKDGPVWLHILSALSGGMYTTAKLRDDLPARARALSRLLHHRYTIGYVPSKPPDGKWRNIRVQLQPRAELKRLKVAVRRGYYAAPR